MKTVLCGAVCMLLWVGGEARLGALDTSSTTLLTTNPPPSTQLNRLTRLSTAVDTFTAQIDPASPASPAATAPTPPPAAASTETTAQRFAHMNVEQAERVRERIKADRQQLKKIKTTIDLFKSTKAETASDVAATTAAVKAEIRDAEDIASGAATTTATATPPVATTNTLTAEATVNNDVPSDRPLNFVDGQVAEGKPEGAVEATVPNENLQVGDGDGVEATDQGAGAPTQVQPGDGPRSPTEGEENGWKQWPKKEDRPTLLRFSALAASVLKVQQGAPVTTGTTTALNTAPKSFIASIPPLDSTELEYPTFPDEKQQETADDQQTDSAWDNTDGMAENMSEGNGMNPMMNPEAMMGGQMQQMQQQPQQQQPQQQQPQQQQQQSVPPQ